MKVAGKKAGLMPPNKTDVEDAADAKKPGDAKEDSTKKTVKVAVKTAVKPKVGGGLAAFISKKLAK